MTPRIPVIVGPTAGGKTDLSLLVAEMLAHRTGRPAEIISADSVQIFRGLDIGSAKPTLLECRGIPHHLINIVEPEASYTVHQWLGDAERTIDDIRSRGHLPIVVGGTHLYIKALLDGLFDAPQPDPALRARLTARGLTALRSELERVDPAAALRIHPNDLRRTVRALEVFHQTGTPISVLQSQWDRQHPRRPDLHVFALLWPTELINRRINQRVGAMRERGLVEEVRRLSPRLGSQAREALGYKQVLEALAGRMSPDDAFEQIKIETRRFAKNQRTWLRRLSQHEYYTGLALSEGPNPSHAAQIIGQCVGPE
ncbi:MAG: tRNA (adenosine(37)-N6)-dimethylallyltransferase MiaA [Leptolyngbya sp. PLA3]|nr:MAG: tRNA (adenosine(37)-N6)-dimethylallyltransferase MiaA [Cyanobacteria bacterium CYA]MCE7967668.1 tRNA (adenosine(37)-N6)-dimethylallyltransferase MiaA [Leptolyngbya sp. PL-A3]